MHFLIVEFYSILWLALGLVYCYLHQSSYHFIWSVSLELSLFTFYYSILWLALGLVYCYLHQSSYHFIWSVRLELSLFTFYYSASRFGTFSVFI
jgi:preprotein translocase subunit SecG